MKYIISVFLILCISLHALAHDTIIYSPTVSLDASFSQYDNVEVVAQNSITLAGGFSFSSNGNGKFTANADIYNIEEPIPVRPFGSSSDSTESPYGSFVVGAINGQVGVSPSGAATYTIPIEVPVGNRGMVPQLAVSYNSQSGIGLLGRGWNLGGLSSIVASGKTK